MVDRIQTFLAVTFLSSPLCAAAQPGAVAQDTMRAGLVIRAQSAMGSLEGSWAAGHSKQERTSTSAARSSTRHGQAQDKLKKVEAPAKAPTALTHDHKDVPTAPSPAPASDTLASVKILRPSIDEASDPEPSRQEVRHTCQSLGEPHRGRLVNGVPLTETSAYTVRAGRNYGHPTLIDTVRDAIYGVYDRYPGTQKIAVGDLSKPNGGPLRNHRSHQSGRDADIGYYLTADHNPHRFRRATESNLDLERTWELVSALAQSPQVEMVFIDYGLQRLLYEHARSTGITAAQLKQIFAYPRGRKWKRSMLRHWPGHADHLHLRIKQPTAIRDRHSIAAPSTE